MSVGWQWTAILFAALVVRLGVAHWWQAARPPDRPFAMADSVSYWHLAGCVARGDPYAYPDDRARIFRTPGYPAALSILWAAGREPSPLAARYLGAVLGTVVVAEVMCLAGILFGSRVALIAGLLAAAYPGGLIMSLLVLSESLFCPLMLAQFLCWSQAVRQEQGWRWTWSAAAGVFAGLATLTRPSWWLFLPWAWLLALADRRRRLGWLVATAAGLIAFTAVMAPWWIRNYRVCGHFVVTSLQVGASLYDGLSPIADGSSNMEFTKSFFRELESEYAGPHPPDDDFEYVLDQRYKSAAIQWARTHPPAVLRLAAIKFWRMWSPVPSASELGSFATSAVIALGYVPLLMGGVAGLWMNRRRGWLVWCLGLPCIYFTSLHVIFVSSLRYRQPAMLLLIVPAAWSAYQLLRYWGWIARDSQGSPPDSLTDSATS